MLERIKLGGSITLGLSVLASAAILGLFVIGVGLLGTKVQKSA